MSPEINMPEQVTDDSASITEEVLIPPTVVISYSHDSRGHKQWVAKLASTLLAKHVQVIFDQWDLEPGDDVPKFMERAVKAADRVLMICTDPYVRKANDGKGGVGYEAMIVTGELVRDLGTRKFIPIIRQVTGEPSVPDCVSTRLYVDCSNDEDFDEAIETLIKTLHQVQQRAKPPLGPVPFEPLSTPSPETVARRVSSEALFEAAVIDPKAAYNIASSLIAASDFTTWRRLLRTLYHRAASDLAAWRSEDETPPVATDKDASPLHDHAAKGVSYYMPLFACLVAGAESGKEEFAGQLGWIDEILNSTEWKREGYVYWVDFPQLLLFVGQALVGSMLIETRASEAAYALATTRIPDLHRSRDSKPLFLDSGVTGWPQSMNHSCTVAWGFLYKLIQRQEWMHEVYGSAEHAQSAVSAYYQMLSFLNFNHLSATGRFESGDLTWAVTVPLTFCSWHRDVVGRGYRTFLGNRALLSRVLEANGLGDPERFQQHWKLWLAECGKWLGNVYHWYLDFDVPQTNLPNDLKSKGLSLSDL